MRIACWLTGVCLFPLFAPALLAQAVKGDDAYVRVLKQHGIAADAPSLQRYLASLVDSDTAGKPQQLIDKLGAEDYFARQAATRQLDRIPVRGELLKKAAASDDSQVRWRAEWLLRKRAQQGEGPEHVLHAALRVIAQQQHKGFTPVLLQAAPHCREGFLEDAVVASLLASATTAEDKKHIEAALGDADAARRRVAVLALHRIAGEDAREHLRKLVSEEKDERVLLAAARALAELGDVSCLPALIRLLRSEDQQVSAQSASLLRTLTGQRFAFDPAAPADKRRTAVAAWDRWVKVHGADARLKPLPTRARVVACLENGTIIGLDGEQNVAWKFDKLKRWQWSRINSPSGCVRLPSGNLLISSGSMGLIVEVTPSGEFVRQLSVGGAASLQRLDNGNLLTSLGHKKKVLEVTPDGKVVWEASVREMVIEVHRLPDGHTLAAIHNLSGLIELNAAGEMVREWDGAPVPASIRGLPGGHLLMTSYKGQVLRYTRDGRLVASIKGLDGVRDAALLESGNYLVALPTGVREVTPDGATVWEQNVGKVNRLLVER